MPRIVIDNRPPQLVFDDSSKIGDGVASFLQSLVQAGQIQSQERRANEHEQLAKLWHNQDYELRKRQVDALLAGRDAKAHPFINRDLWKSATDQYTTTDPLGVRSVDHVKALDFYNRNARAAGLPSLDAVPEDPPAAPAPPPAPAAAAPTGWLESLKNLFSSGAAPAIAEPGAAPMYGPPAPAEPGALSRMFNSEPGAVQGSEFSMGEDTPEPAPAPAPMVAAPAVDRRQVFIHAFGTQPKEIDALTSDDPATVRTALVAMPPDQRLKAISALAAIHGHR